MSERTMLSTTLFYFFCMSTTLITPMLLHSDILLNTKGTGNTIGHKILITKDGNKLLNRNQKQIVPLMMIEFERAVVQNYE